MFNVNISFIHYLGGVQSASRTASSTQTTSAWRGSPSTTGPSGSWTSTTRASFPTTVMTWGGDIQIGVRLSNALIRECPSRYDYQSQVNIGLWNLDKLATALKPLINADKHAQLENVLKGYGDIYQKHHLKLFRYYKDHTCVRDKIAIEFISEQSWV